MEGRLDGPLQVGVEANEKPAYRYPTKGAYTGSSLSHRAKVGGGIAGTRYAFTFENMDGDAFDLDRVEAIVDTLTRTR